ncbi:hypothetical protein DFJ74DRAFT_210510 [Hyaloraphidium curvatum]|nr:hypothetical protein DFJ74DRAFT_210510 [Hyaloraphidium curvatum]
MASSSTGDGAGRKDFTTIPIVDLAKLKTDRKGLIADLRHALADVGFCYVKNAEGFDDATQQRLFELGHQFTTCPTRGCSSSRRTGTSSATRWVRLLGSVRVLKNRVLQPPKKTELLQEFHYSYDHPEQPPHDERIPLHRRVLYGPNVWPDLPDFKEAFEAHLASCDRLNKTLQHLTAEMLGLPETAFDPWFWGPAGERRGFASVRILHYTPLEEASEERKALLPRAADDGSPLSLNAHRDATAFLTVLINDSDGLEVLNHSGKWIAAPPLPGHVIVNVGMPLMNVTSGYLLATMHRVNANKAPKRRISIPCFLSPDPDRPMHPLPELRAKELSPEAKAAIAASAENLKAWNTKDTARRILIQRRINHSATFEKYWPKVLMELDAELGNGIRISL